MKNKFKELYLEIGLNGMICIIATSMATLTFLGIAIHSLFI